MARFATTTFVMRHFRQIKGSSSFVNPIWWLLLENPVVQRFSWKSFSEKCLKCLQQNTCHEVLFLVELQACIFIKKDSIASVFLRNFQTSCSVQTPVNGYFWSCTWFLEISSTSLSILSHLIPHNLSIVFYYVMQEKKWNFWFHYLCAIVGLTKTFRESKLKKSNDDKTPEMPTFKTKMHESFLSF